MACAVIAAASAHAALPAHPAAGAYDPQTAGVVRGAATRFEFTPASIGPMVYDRARGGSVIWGLGSLTERRSDMPAPYDPFGPAPVGEVVLRRTSTSGWQVAAPVRDVRGRGVAGAPVRMVMTAGDEGYALTSEQGGAYTTVLHHAAGSSTWDEWPLWLKATLAVPLQPADIAVSPDGHTLFAVGTGPAGVVAVDTATGASHVETAVGAPGGGSVPVIDRLAVSPGGDAWGLGPSLQSQALPGVSAGATTVVYHREVSAGQATWQPVLTGRPFIDQGQGSPEPTPGTVVFRDTFLSAVAVSGEALWITGSADAVNDTAAATANGSSTPPFAFVLRADLTRQTTGSRTLSSTTLFCPERYDTSLAGKNSNLLPVEPCDASMPRLADAPAEVVALDHVCPGGAVEAQAVTGSDGLVEFRDRDGDAAPCSGKAAEWQSVASGSGDIRHIAATGVDEVVATASDHEEVNVDPEAATATAPSAGPVTHRTGVPSGPAHTAVWPQAGRAPLHAVAVDPATGAALAVGRGGRAVRYDPGRRRWVETPTGTSADLHAVAFVAPGAAVAVGDHGTVLRFASGVWALDPASGRVSAPLLALAVRGPGDALAVGGGGAELHLGPAGWAVTPPVTGRDLETVTAASGQFVAAGTRAVVLVGDGTSMHVDPAAAAAAGPSAPTLEASASGVGGEVVLAGVGVVLSGGPGRWSTDGLPPLQGDVGALARCGGTLVATVGPSDQMRMSVGRADPQVTQTVSRASLVALVGGEWTDLGTTAPRPLLIQGSSEPGAARPDPPLAVACDGTGAGWAVGGQDASVTGVYGEDETSLVPDAASSSLWRIDPLGAAALPPATPAVPVEDRDAFAFMSGTACGDGTHADLTFCSEAAGAGFAGDVASIAALADVTQLRSRLGIPAFVIDGGNLRANGEATEMRAARRLLDGFGAVTGVPVFGALGPDDLVPKVRLDALTGVQTAPAATDAPWLQAFAMEPRPWGQGPAVPGTTPLFFSPSRGVSQPLASTHYAFSWEPHGSSRLDVAVVDDSQGSLALGALQQNPPETQQLQQSFLQSVKADAGGRMVVVASLPPLLSESLIGNAGDPRAPVDSDPADTALLAGVPLVLSGSTSTNAVYSLPASRQQVVVAGAGGQSFDTATPRPDNGRYLAWTLVGIGTPANPAAAPGTTACDRPAGGAAFGYEVCSFPILDWLTLTTAGDRRTVAAGNTLSVTGLGRVPDLSSHTLGSSFGHPEYIDFPTCAGAAQPDACGDPHALHPSYMFVSGNRSVGQFVVPDPYHPDTALLDTSGHAIASDRSGLFCAYNPGTTTLYLVSGTHADSTSLTVSAGDGRHCGLPPSPPIVHPFYDRTSAPAVVAAVKSAAAPQAPRPQASVPRAHPGPNSIGVVAPAPPPVVVIPAVPIGYSTAPAPKREEERETAVELSDAFVRAHHRATVSPSWAQAGAEVAGAALAAWLLATATAAARRRRWRPARAHQTPTRSAR